MNFLTIVSELKTTPRYYCSLLCLSVMFIQEPTSLDACIEKFKMNISEMKTL